MEIPTVSPEAIRLEFLPQGSTVPEPEGEAETLALDVGNRLGPGVVDHHHLSAYGGSTAGLVVRHPELIVGAVREDRSPRDVLVIRVHEWPDLDAVASFYLVRVLLTTGEFPAGADWLARYADRVDQGLVGATLDYRFSLYVAYMVILHRLAGRSWDRQEDLWRRAVEEGAEVVEYVLSRSVAGGTALPEVDAFGCPGRFGPRDRAAVDEDVARYREKLDDPVCNARTTRLILPTALGGERQVDALLVRNVQRPDDPERCLFFKDWARSDRERSEGGDGFVALSVYSDEWESGPRRCILSVRPDAEVTLQGLGAKLDEAEAEARRRALGVDDRVVDPETGAPLAARPGYANADPWYDGRAHGYTIVDAPREGTLLTAEEIEDAFLEFGRSPSAREPIRIVARESRDDAAARDDALRQLTSLARIGAETGPREDGGGGVTAEVFISYPRRRLEWVAERIYGPVADWRGEDAVFFDVDSLEGGAGWLARLAAAVAGCTVFVAVYCPEYFRSDFCQWELQLAVVRDPLGAKGIVLPVLLEETELPAYCSLIQAEDGRRPGFRERFLRNLATRFDVDGQRGAGAQVGPHGA